jgi:hypothetical protein
VPEVAAQFDTTLIITAYVHYVVELSEFNELKKFTHPGELLLDCGPGVRRTLRCDTVVSWRRGRVQ